MGASETGSVAQIPAGELLRYELRDVTASERKMDETQRETDPSVVASVKQFVVDTAGFYTPADAAQYGDALYGAMNSAGAQMAGLGPADTYPFKQLYSVTGADGFYTINVSQRWKELEGARIGVDWNSPLVFAAWKDAVTTGQNMDEDMLEPTSTALPVNSWLSPDYRMTIPPPPTRDQANSDFFKFCHVVSLAPEWYADGLVRLNPPPAGGFKRPVSFDGMTSPLWVQRPPDKHAATGGDAIETLNATAIDLSSCYPLQAYIVTDAMTAALNASPSVNIYSVDLSKVSPGSTPEENQLAEEEISIVEQVRRARTEADKGFRNDESGSNVFSPLALASTLGGDAPVTPRVPVPRKRSYRSIAELKAQMEAWARAGLIEHRGQRFPAERFQKEAKQSPEAARAIAEAAAELLAESNDPRVLLMAAQLADNTTHRPFYEAVIGRLQKGVPDVKGIRSGTLRNDLLNRLTDRIPATAPDLSARAHDILKREGRPDLRLAMLNYFDPKNEMVDVLGEVCQQPANPSLVAHAAGLVAMRAPERLVEAAGHLASQNEKTRVLALAEIRRRMPAGDFSNVAKTLGLS
jgi:hypothetical protein